MAENAKYGTDWESQELDQIVEDYFDMLSRETLHKFCIHSLID